MSDHPVIQKMTARVSDTRQAPCRYNRVVQALLKERKGDFMANKNHEKMYRFSFEKLLSSFGNCVPFVVNSGHEANDVRMLLP